MKRVSDLKKYILEMYPNLPKDKMDVVKIGPRIWIVLVTKQSTLIREKLYSANLETVNDIAVLKKVLDTNINKILTKYNYN